MFNIREPILDIWRLDYIWECIIKFYTCLDLTHEKDRLPALSGIASQLFHESEYLAGLRRHSLSSDLCWMRIPSSTPTSPVSTQSGTPSWSWAAIQSPVEFGQNLHDFPGRSLEIIEAVCNPETKNPFGRVSSGCLTVRGSVLEATLLPLVSSKGQYSPQDLYTQHILLRGQQTVVDEYMTFYLDSTVVEESYLSAQTVLLLSCSWREGSDESFMLVLRKLPDKEATYQRIGAATDNPQCGEANHISELAWNIEVIKIV
jgi:hypothetical protein